MCMLYKRAIVSMVVVLCSLSAGLRARADIYRWDNNQLIAGTEGVEPGPGEIAVGAVVEPAVAVRIDEAAARAARRGDAGSADLGLRRCAGDADEAGRQPDRKQGRSPHVAPPRSADDPPPIRRRP